MQTLARQRERVAAHKEAAYDRQRQYEASLLLDELTDQSERLARPMENGFVYTFGADGKLYSEYGDQLEKVFTDGLDMARAMALRDPDNWAFELTRRTIELEEIQAVQVLADGEKLITFSPVPDLVRAGRTNINGYDRNRKKMLVRIAERQGDEVGIFSFSLDGSDYIAMQAAARSIGAEIPDGLGSEEILSRRFHYGIEHDYSMKDCHDLIRVAYDLSLERRLGGTWYAGRHEIKQEDALSFIKRQGDLVSQHMEAVKRVMAQAIDAAEKNRLLENLRYDFAAALDDRMHGREVADISSAGESARSEGRTYDGDCPTGTNEQAMALGYNQGANPEMKCVICPYCKQTVDAIMRSDGIFCPNPECSMHPPELTRQKDITKPASMFDMISRWLEEAQMKREAEKRRRRQQARLGKQSVEPASSPRTGGGQQARLSKQSVELVG